MMFRMRGLLLTGSGSYKILILSFILDHVGGDKLCEPRLSSEEVVRIILGGAGISDALPALLEMLLKQ